MSYDPQKRVTLAALKTLAERTKREVDGSNVIEKIKVGGVELPVGPDKSVEIPGGGTARFEVAQAAPSAAEAQDGVLYLVQNAGTYDIYVKAGDQVVKTGDTAVDLSGYVEKEPGKGLSANDFTDADKAKLDGMRDASDAEVAELLNEVFGA